MRKLLLLLMLLCSTWALAQDVIVKTDGSSVLCRIVEVNSTEVVYKKWSDLKGSNYVMNRKDVSTINYENGKKEVISLLDNKYSPYNQNTGYGQMNDNALALMDMASSNPQKKAKMYKKIGLIGGGIFVATGLALICYGAFDRADKGFDEEAELMYGIGGGLSAIGLIGGGVCLIQSRKYQRQADLIQSTTMIEHEVSFKNGSSLALGVDKLNVTYMNQNAFGIGLRYSF